MRFTVSSSIAAVALLVSAVLATTLPGDSIIPQCEGQTVLSEQFIGKDQNVKAQVVQCANALVPQATAPNLVGRTLDARQSSNGTNSTNVCGATCNTNCFTPSGGGPDPNECHVITDALLYDSQNVGALFDLNPAQNTSLIVMTYRSCQSFMVNQVNSTLTYCRTDWAAVLDFVAFNCQSTQNAHGGNCVASDQRWFIQVQAA